MMTHPFDKLILDNGAGLIFTPCPGTKAVSVEQSLQDLKAAGASVLITLMNDDELAANNAQSIAVLCEKLAITWLQLPISDDKGPDSEFDTKWLAHQPELVALLNQQASIAIHCKGGSGRTGLMVGLLLKALGHSTEQAKALVQSYRPKALTKATQLGYFESFYSGLIT